VAERSARRARIERLLEAARILAHSGNFSGQAWRAAALTHSGLSQAGVELAIERCLERRVSDAELTLLLAGTPEAPHAHVLLSANVFVAALRAIAIGLAASERVSVRASRRDPGLANALHELTPGLFEIVPELAPAAGDRVWAYGADATLASLRASLPAGVWLHAHGHGFGAVVVEERDGRDPLAEARAIALDTLLFDQRGCLSPRVVCVRGSESAARELAEALAAELGKLELEVAPGPRSPPELAEARRWHDAAAYAFELFAAGSGLVSFSATGELSLPPVGRNLHVVGVSDPLRTLAPFHQHLTCVGVSASAELESQLRSALGGARFASLGEMQRPPLDGPVDRRHGPDGERSG
jgi:hypothetical protein